MLIKTRFQVERRFVIMPLMFSFTVLLLCSSVQGQDTQIKPNPNDGTITIVDPNTNSVSFTNNGTIRIETIGSLGNQSDFHNFFAIDNFGTFLTKSMG